MRSRRDIARSRGMHGNSDDDRDRIESQEEWANWAEHGYRKLYQPRSVRRFGLVFTIVLLLVLLTVFWLAARGR
jgi:hypothetical protein